jgi:hypothetical protein
MWLETIFKWLKYFLKEFRHSQYDRNTHPKTLTAIFVEDLIKEWKMQCRASN